MALTLRDGSTVKDPRLNRIAQLNPRNRDYPVQLPPRVQLKTKVHRLDRRWLGDQGSEGACVEYGITHVLSATPLVQLRKIVEEVRRRHLIYWHAQGLPANWLPSGWRGDPWAGGSYPGATPSYEGTSEEAGLMVAVHLGFIKKFEWAFGIDQALAGLMESPGNLALNWTEEMADPRPDGLIRGGGRVIGGHDVACTGMRLGVRLPDDGPRGPKRNVIIIPQSWGLGHGNRGFVYLPFEDFEVRLKDQGTCSFLRGEEKLTKLPA
jgi:hypothetical protein